MGSPGKTAEKVLRRSPSETESGTCWASSRSITQTMEEESRPPERHVPTATSATRRRSTARVKRRRNSFGSGSASSLMTAGEEAEELLRARSEEHTSELQSL